MSEKYEIETVDRAMRRIARRPKMEGIAETDSLLALLERAEKRERDNMKCRPRNRFGRW